MARADADGELDRLRADLVGLVLREAGAAAADQPEKFLSARFTRAVQAAAVEAAEARLAAGPSAEDVAEQVLAGLRAEVRALAQGVGDEGGSAVRRRVAAGGRGGPAELAHWETMTPLQRLALALKGHEIAAAVTALLLVAVVAVAAFFAGSWMEGASRAGAAPPPATAGQLEQDTGEDGPITLTPDAAPQGAAGAAAAAPQPKGAARPR